MNINEFERNKPRSTYTAILDLKSFISDCEAENSKNRVYDLNLLTMKEKLDKIETHFLLGE